MTSFQCHNCYYSTEKRHQTNVTRFFPFCPLPPNQNFWPRQWM